jgi:tRNA threonylcarbamoyladenosine biosynthesis protein TsaE
MENPAPASTHHCQGEDAMLALGRSLGAQLAHGDIVLLQGGLGAGKTTLAKGLVAGFGAAQPEDVSSPTFAIVHEYKPRRGGRHSESNALPLVYHLDLYRLEAEDELWAIGFEDLLIDVLSHSALMLVEWAERFPSVWPSHARRIVIHDGDDARRVEVFAPPGH